MRRFLVPHTSGSLPTKREVLLPALLPFRRWLLCTPCLGLYRHSSAAFHARRPMLALTCRLSSAHIYVLPTGSAQIPTRLLHSRAPDLCVTPTELVHRVDASLGHQVAGSRTDFKP